MLFLDYCRFHNLNTLAAEIDVLIKILRVLDNVCNLVDIVVKAEYRACK